MTRRGSAARRGRSPDRRRAREAAVQVLYLLDAQEAFDRVAELLPLYLESLAEDTVPGLSDAGRRFAEDLCRGAAQNVQAIDATLRHAADRWRLERMDRVDRAVLRLATHELMAESGAPAPVVINEAVELAKTYGAAPSGRFVNGVLARVARGLGR